MATGQADLAIGPQPLGWTGPVRPLGVEEFVVVLPADDPTVEEGSSRVDLRTLADCNWVHYAPDNGLADIVDQACSAAGFRPKALVRTEQTAAAPVLAAAGLGPALVPANIIPPRFNGRVLRPDPPVVRSLVAYTRSTPDSVTVAFTEMLAKTVCVTPGHAQKRLGLEGLAGGSDRATYSRSWVEMG